MRVADGAVGVATDAFFLLQRFGAPSKDSIHVVVTTEAGEPVLGALIELENGELGWAADQALPTQTKLNVHVEVTTSGKTDDAVLTVVGPPTELAAPVVSYGEWIDLRHGIGPFASCANAVGSCGGSLVSVPTAEEALRGVHVIWTPPAQVNGFIAWQARVEDASLISETNSMAPIIYQAQSAPRDLGRVAFLADSVDHCVTLALHDLRTGATQKADLCAQPAVATRTEWDYSLEVCAEPPSPAVLPAWCQSHPGDYRCSDGAGGGGQLPGAGAGGVGGVGGAPQTWGGSKDDVIYPAGSNDGTRSPNLTPDAESSGTHTASACQFTPAGSSVAGGGAALGALALSLIRRRRR